MVGAMPRCGSNAKNKKAPHRGLEDLGLGLVDGGQNGRPYNLRQDMGHTNWGRAHNPRKDGGHTDWGGAGHRS